MTLFVRLCTRGRFLRGLARLLAHGRGVRVVRLDGEAIIRGGEDGERVVSIDLGAEGHAATIGLAASRQTSDL